MPYEFVSDDVFVNYTFHNILQKRPKKHFHQGKQTVLRRWENIWIFVGLYSGPYVEV